MTEGDDRDEFAKEFAYSPWDTLVLLAVCAVALPFDILKNLWFLATGQSQKYRRIFDNIRMSGSEHLSS